MQPHTPSASPPGAVRSRISRIPPLSATPPGLARAMSASLAQPDPALSQTSPASFSLMGARALSAGDGDALRVSPWQQDSSPSAAAAAVLSSTLPLPQRSPRLIPPMNGHAPAVISSHQFTQMSSDGSLQPAATAPQFSASSFSPGWGTSPFPLQSFAAPPVSVSSQLQPHPYAINQSPQGSPLPAPPPSYPLSALPNTLPLPPPMSNQLYLSPIQPPPTAAAPLPVLPDIASLLHSVSLPQYIPSFFHTGFADVPRLLSLSPDSWSATMDAVQADAMLRVHRGELPADSVQLQHKAVVMQLLSNQQAHYAALVMQQQRSAPSSSPFPQQLPGPAAKPDASASSSPPSLTPHVHDLDEHGPLMSGICALARHWCCCLSIGGFFLLVSGLAYLVYQHTDDSSGGFGELLKALCAVGFALGGCALLLAVRSWKRFPEHRGCTNATCCDGEEEDEWCWTKWTCCQVCREKCDEAGLCCASAPNTPSCWPAGCCLPCCRGGCQLSCCSTPTSAAPCCSLPSCACCVANPNGPTCGNRLHDCCAPATAGVSDCCSSVHASISACLTSVVAVCTPKPSPQQKCCPTCPTCGVPACPCLAACWSHPCMECCSCCECDCDGCLERIGCGEWCTGKHGGGCCGCASELTAGCRATTCYKVICCQFKIQVN